MKKNKAAQPSSGDKKKAPPHLSEADAAWLKELGARGLIEKGEAPRLRAIGEGLGFKMDRLSGSDLQEKKDVSLLFQAIYERRPQSGAPAASWVALMDAVGVDVDARVWTDIWRDEEEAMTLAAFACWQKKPKLLALIADRIDLGQRDIHQRSLANHAASFDRPECLAILADKGVDMDRPEPGDDKGRSLLMIACQSSSGGARMLATPERCRQRSAEGKTPLMILCEWGRVDLEALRLVASMSDLAAQDPEGKTALHFAVRHGQTKPERLWGANLLPQWSVERPQYYADTLLALGGVGLLDIADHEGRRPEDCAEGEFTFTESSGSFSEWLSGWRIACAEADALKRIAAAEAEAGAHSDTDERSSAESPQKKQTRRI